MARRTIRAHEKHISDVKPDCDFVVDGTSTIDDIVENILKALPFYKPAV